MRKHWNITKHCQKCKQQKLQAITCYNRTLKTAQPECCIIINIFTNHKYMHSTLSTLNMCISDIQYLMRMKPKDNNCVWLDKIEVPFPNLIHTNLCVMVNQISVPMLKHHIRRKAEYWNLISFSKVNWHFHAAFMFTISLGLLKGMQDYTAICPGLGLIWNLLTTNMKHSH